MTDTVVSADPMSDPLRAGRDALERHAWDEAFGLLTRADRESTLGGDDLEALAVAAFFAGHGDDVVELKERAFKAHADAGNDVRAAYTALDVARDYAMHRKASIAGAWMRRGERLLEGQPESYVHGYLALVRSGAARESGEVDAAIAFAEEATAIAERTGDGDLRGWALTALGTLRIGSGAATEGLALLEEASIAAVNGELSPFSTGVVCCTMIAACRDLTDYQRASEWIEATDRYCQRQSVAGFPGVCRIHRAEMVALTGAWERAEQELRQATAELARFNATPPMADGYYALGEVRRLQGDLAGAEEALREAHALGRSPQPALALIRLAEGKVKAAVAAINAAVDDEVSDRWARARLLPAQAEISIAGGDIAPARTAIDELERIVSGYRAPALQASLHGARARVLLGEGDPGAAARELRSGIRLWREVGSPYEVARARALLAAALRALDDEDDADLELKAARDEFERLGAQPDAAAAARDLQAAADRRGGPMQIQRTFMFTDVVGSTQLAELLGDDAWEHLLQWHDDTIRALVGKGHGEVVNSTGDGFFAAFDNAVDAIACASSIQQALAEHRRSTGFAIPVRIGLHSATANRRGADYSGVAVNVAARVMGVAQGGEIVASAETLAEAPDVATLSPREVELRGVSGVTRIATVRWS